MFRALSALAAISLLLLACVNRPLATPGGTFQNPIIRGFAPDPSIVRVDQDFFLVNSSFEYFPGLPIYHSRDLVNWTLISYALSDPNQIDLATVDSSGGVHAATIRYHDGLFYVVTTNIVDGQPVSFIVTADDPRGPWSAPVVIDDAVGIDPSLFFDDDGRVWYTANWVPPDPEFSGQAEIWLQELNLKTLQLTGPREFLWRGCCQGTWAEGPHIYKRNGTYYLLISEGGTSYEHAISIAAADAITGPYRNNPRNPVLSHRHLSYDHPFTGVGHADLVELADGRWYGVALGWRLLEGRHGILGRETFLFPVTWETDREWWKNPKQTWPVFSALSGKIDAHYPLPFSEAPQTIRAEFEDSFDQTTLHPEWNLRRAPGQPFHSLVERPGTLRLRLLPSRIGDNAAYSFIGVRQRDFRFSATTELGLMPAAANEEAGLVVIQNDRAALSLTLSGEPDSARLTLSKWLYGERTTLAEAPVATTDVRLRVDGDQLDYQFSFAEPGRPWQALDTAIDGTFLSPADLRGFNYTGVYIGLYASANGQPSSSHVDIASFSYQPQR